MFELFFFPLKNIPELYAICIETYYRKRSHIKTQYSGARLGVTKYRFW